MALVSTLARSWIAVHVIGFLGSSAFVSLQTGNSKQWHMQDGLEWEDRTLEENLGIAAKFPKSVCNRPVDVVFVIDDSSSITFADFDKVKTLMKEVTKRFTIGGGDGALFGAVMFSTNSKMMWKMNSAMDTQSLAQKINAMKHAGGNTATYKGLQDAEKMFDSRTYGNRPSAEDVVILLTDGGSGEQGDMYRKMTINQAKKMKDGGIRIVTIALGKAHSDKSNWDEIQQIASIDPAKPDERNVFDAEFTDLAESFYSDLAFTACPACGREEPCQAKPKDVVFILDQSRSITPQDYRKMKKFISHVVEKLPISQNEVRVGLIQFAGRISGVPPAVDRHQPNIKIEFDLDDSFDVFKIMEKIGKLEQQSSDDSTLTNLALKLARDEMLTVSHGARTDNSEVNKVVIVLTDGESVYFESKTPEEASKLQQQARVIAIGVGSKINSKEIEAIASVPKSRNSFWRGVTFEKLDRIRDELVQQICVKRK